MHPGLLDTLLAPIARWTVATIQAMGYPGIALLMALESACIPLPSEITLPFAGYLVAKGVFNLHLAAAAGAIGCLLGSWVAYAVGYFGGRPLLMRYGKYVLVSHHDIELADRWFAKYGDGAVFLGRLLPIVRTFISLPAGIARVPFLKFSAFSLVGSWIWSYALVYAGVKLGEHWERLREAAHSFDTAIAGILVLAVALYVWRHLGGRTALAKPNRP